MLLAVGAECREEGDGQSPLDMAANENIHYSIEGDMRLVLRVDALRFAWRSMCFVFLCERVVMQCVLASSVVPRVVSVCVALCVCRLHVAVLQLFSR